MNQIFEELRDSITTVIIAGALIVFLFTVYFVSMGAEIKASQPNDIITDKSLQTIETQKEKNPPAITSLDHTYKIDTTYQASDFATSSSDNGDIVALYINKAEDGENSIDLNDHTVTFSRPGTYRIRIVAIDSAGKKTSKKLHVVVNGNEVTQ